MNWTGILKEVSRSADDGPWNFCTVWDKFVPNGDGIYFRWWLTSTELSVHRNLSENPETEGSNFLRIFGTNLCLSHSVQENNRSSFWAAQTVKTWKLLWGSKTHKLRSTSFPVDIYCTGFFSPKRIKSRKCGHISCISVSKCMTFTAASHENLYCWWAIRGDSCTKFYLNVSRSVESVNLNQFMVLSQPWLLL
jgi:hypothetical protein